MIAGPVIAVPAHRKSERGFALLIVFLMAAAIALMLYMQMPRVAFESERDKEQLLIDRGEQYKRGIQLYLQANRRFPSSLDDLEQRDRRFLRRRYVDPYTGKNEWRLIHSSGQYLTDSLVQKPPDPNATQNASTGSTNGADNQPTVNAATLQRPSDRVLTPLNGAMFADPNNPAVYPGSQIGDPQNPALVPRNGSGATSCRRTAHTPAGCVARISGECQRPDHSGRSRYTERAAGNSGSAWWRRAWKSQCRCAEHHQLTADHAPATAASEQPGPPAKQ
jgi:hypothetical protein